MKNLILTLSLIFITSILIFNTGCKKEELKEEVTTEQSKKLRYEIDCPDCYVVYYSYDEEQVSLTGKSTGWYKDLDVKTGFVGLIIAQNQSGTPAAVTATIKLNDEIIQSKTSYCPVTGTVFVTDTIH